MRFSIAPQIFEKFPNYCVGGLVAIDLNNRLADEQKAQIYHTLLDAALLLRRRFATGESAPGGAHPFTGNPAIAMWREAFRQAGIKPGEYPSSVEALSRRALREGGLPSINPAVDLANTVSLMYMLPLGGHDLDELVGDFEVRLSREGDFFSPVEAENGQVESVPSGEPVYADAAEIRTRRWVWRQGRKARVTEASRNIFFPIDGWVGVTDEQVREATTQLKNLLTETLGAQCQAFFVDASTPSFEWDIKEETQTSGPFVIKQYRRERDKIDELLTRSVSDIVGREELEAQLRSGTPLRVKFGIDPTGPQIHIGRTVPLWKLRDFQDLGHQIVLVFGTFTAQIGDVSGHTNARPILTSEQVFQNMATYKEQVSLILDASKVEWRFNSNWFDGMTFKQGIELMSHFTVAQMLERDNFSQRLAGGKPIQLHELVYPVLQGYDSTELKNDVEVGGTDQMFNMMAARTLQHVFNQPQQAVLMTKMINAPDGHKMSTSLGNGVYITEPPKDLYAKMLKTVDEQILEYFEMLTRVPLSDLEAMQAALDGGENPVLAKKRLARTLVAQYYGPEAAEEAAEAFEREIVQKEVPDEIPEYTPPSGITEMDIRDLLVETKLAASKKEAARLIEQGGVSVDGEKVSDSKAKIALRSEMLLKRGNRHYARVKL